MNAAPAGQPPGGREAGPGRRRRMTAALLKAPGSPPDSAQGGTGSVRGQLRSWQVALAASSLALPLLNAAGPATSQSESSAPAALWGPPPQTRLREECFVLELQAEQEGPAGAPATAPSPSGETAAGAASVGLARARRLLSSSGQQLELDVVFFDDSTRVLHVEHSAGGEAKLVWRELRPGSGRTLSAHWLDGSRSLEVREWAGRRSHQTEVQAPSGGILPLHLLELVRDGALEGGSVPVFDPLSRALEAVALRVIIEPASSRRVELVREDGTLAGVWEFDGASLVAFQWQAGGLRARRIAPEEYARRLEPLSAQAEH